MGYATITQFKDYLGIKDSGDDALLTRMLLAAQKAVDAFCMRTFEAAADTTRYFDAIKDVDGPMLIVDKDLAAITTVTNGDGVVVAASSYFTEPVNGTPIYGLVLKGSSGLSWTYLTDPERAISIAGKWAYSLTAPDDVVQATIRLAAHFFRGKDAQVFDVTATPGLGQMFIPKGFPQDVRLLLGPYKVKL